MAAPAPTPAANVPAAKATRTVMSRPNPVPTAVPAPTAAAFVPVVRPIRTVT